MPTTAVVSRSDEPRHSQDPEPCKRINDGPIIGAAGRTVTRIAIVRLGLAYCGNWPSAFYADPSGSNKMR
ncbi:MAG: hypothetical protein IIC51_02975 [Planctomycetes bacterium]|nr:hypothetical protein [Planctomycetota bacterium]